MMSDMNIVKKIRLNLCQDHQEFAQELGVSVPTIYSWENGNRKPSRIKNIKILMQLAKKAKVKAKVEDFLI